MNMDFVYYVFLFITVISYLIGLFLSQFEKKEKMASAGNAGYVKTFEMQNSIDNKTSEEEII